MILDYDAKNSEATTSSVTIQAAISVTYITHPNFRGLPERSEIASILQSVVKDTDEFTLNLLERPHSPMASLDDIQHPQTRIEIISLNGKPFDHETIRSVWEKAKRQPGFETFSLDHRGTTINIFEYGRRSAYGWVIQRIVPLTEGGTDHISNLRPLHWKHFEHTTTNPLSPDIP